MNFLKNNWKWLLVAFIVVAIFIAVKYKNRPVAVKIEDKNNAQLLDQKTEGGDVLIRQDSV